MIYFSKISFLSHNIYPFFPILESEEEKEYFIGAGQF